MQIKVYGADEDNFETQTALGTFDSWKAYFVFMANEFSEKHLRHDWWKGGSTTEPWTIYDVCWEQDGDNCHFRIYG